jgi:hypothetical protein
MMCSRDGVFSFKIHATRNILVEFLSGERYSGTHFWSIASGDTFLGRNDSSFL